VTRLQKTVLSWDLFDLFERSLDDNASATGAELPEVAQTYSTVEDYLATFTPLLLEECASQTLRENEGDQGVANPAVVSSAEQKGEFIFARFVVDSEVSKLYVDNDLLLLIKDNPDASWEDADQRLHCLGQVEGSEGTGAVRLRFYLSDKAQEGNAAGLTRVKAMRTGILTPSSCWYMKKLSNMSTITREWVALQSVRKLPFMRDLLTATVGEKHGQKLTIPPEMRSAMEQTYNQSQMKAIQSGLDGSPINLVQGPPGTGKTKTILGLLSIIMHSVPQDYKEILAQGKSGGSGCLLAEDAERLWRKLSPHLVGLENPRDFLPIEADFALEGNPGNDSSFGLKNVAVPYKVVRGTSRRNHVLVCAPSNSALDEIVSRLMNFGLMDDHGKMYTPSIVRVGVNIHHSVASVSLDNLVTHRLTSAGKEASSKNRSEWDQMRLAILDEADIVASTLSFSGSGLFSRMSRRFDMVVIDEAAQAVEPAIFIPLINGCRQVFLVGDPVQLPATVISQKASEKGYDTSLFKRLMTAGYPVNMLDTQYRMHPDICSFPSQQFYKNCLKNGPNVSTETYREWHKFPCLGPFAFFNVDSEESIPEGSTSLVNEAEAAVVLAICGELMQRYPQLRTEPVVAVITPYKAQVKLIRNKFITAMGKDVARIVDVNTIDGFQGREKDVAIFSAVRGRQSKSNRNIGFVADERRINVGLTRARASMIVVGNASTLEVDENWSTLVASARARGCLWNAQAPYNDFIRKAITGSVVAAPPNPDSPVPSKKRKPSGGQQDGEPPNSKRRAATRPC